MLKRHQYKAELQRLQWLCSRNYALLLRLLPLEYNRAETLNFTVSGQLQFCLTLVETTRYTELWRLTQRKSGMPSFLATEIEFRVYHDAQMVEVLSYQNQRKIRQSYDYPNPNLHHRDEKVQINALMQDWLTMMTNHPKDDAVQALATDFADE